LIRVGVLGYGHWGSKLARNIAASFACELAAICDISPARVAQGRLMHPGIPLVESSAMLISDPRIDAIVIATPVQSHFELAFAALRAGKHVLVEKPMTRTSEEALALMEASERRRLVLMVDHTFLFSPAIDAISQVLRNGDLGRLLYWNSDRLNLGLVRSDVNVMWDLVSHDLAILHHLLPSSPCAIVASGMVPDPGRPEHLVHVTLRFPDGFLAHFYASWISPVKVRRTVVGGNLRTLVYDDLDAANKITIQDCSIVRDPVDTETRYHCGPIRAVETGVEEPLRRAVDHFADCIARAQRPIADAVAGLRVVRLLEAASASLAAAGRIVSVDSEGVVI
jgi:predicted dehydrogenase